MSVKNENLDLNIEETIDGATPQAASTALENNRVVELLKGTRAGLRQKGPWILFWTVVILGFPIALSDNKEWLSVVVFGMIASIGALGMNIQTGYAGQASFGHGFFMGLGAYTAALLGGAASSNGEIYGLGWSFLLWIPIAGLAAGLIGLIVGPLALRLQGLYLALATVALVFVGLHLFSNLKPVTGGANGRQFPAPKIGDLNFAFGGQVGPFNLNRDQLYYFLVVLILLLSILFVTNVMKSRSGRAFMAIRDREVAAELIGINLARTKVSAFVFASILTGIAGALYGSYLRFAEPGLWGLHLSVQFIAMIIIGGVGSVGGSIIGAMLLTALPRIIEITTGSNPWDLNLLPFVTTEAGTQGLTISLFNQLLYALFLIAFLLFEPQGCLGLFHRLSYKFKVLLSKKK